MARKTPGTKEKHYTTDQRAKFILEAVTMGDAQVCAHYGLNPQTLRRWRRDLKNDGKRSLSECVQEKRRALDEQWAEKIPGCLNSCVEFLSVAARTADPGDPDAIHAVAGAMKLVSEVAATWKIIDARISGQPGQGGAADRPLPAATNVTPIRRAG